jgi:glutathione S-transferase
VPHPRPFRTGAQRLARSRFARLQVREIVDFARLGSTTPDHTDDEESLMKLYGFGPTRSLRAEWALQELGIPYEFVPVDLQALDHQTPEFLALNPAGRVPVLVDGTLVVPESAAIVLYLADKHPERGLMPVSIEERAQAYRWILFGMTEIEQPLWRIARHTFLYPEQQRLPADIALARSDFTTMAKVLDDHMASRPFVVGQQFSAADCVLAYLMDWAHEEKLLGTSHNLLRYLEEMYARPAAPPRIAEAMARLESA